MPSIQDAIARNKARIAAGGQTGTGIGPQASINIAPTPPQDLPVGNGIPQRGMFSADLVLASDRSDSSRAFRGQGTRSAAFPYSVQGIKTAPTIVVPAASAAAAAVALALETNGLPNPNQNLLNLVQGANITITANPDGSVVIVGTGGDGLFHGDAIWDVDPAVSFWRDDFYFGSATNATGGVSTFGELRWDALVGSGATYNKVTGYSPYFGQIRIDAGTTTTTCSQIFSPRGNAPDSGTIAGGVFSAGLPLLDYAGWKMVWIFGFPVSRSQATATPFPLTKTQFYCGLAPPASLTTSVAWQPNAVNARPPFFVGLRYDTDPGLGTFTLTSVANASGGTTVYTGTITGGGATFIDKSFTITGFTNPANNGTFICTTANSTTLTLINTGGVAETHAATAKDISISDSTFQFEVVSNLNNNANRINTSGTVVNTGITPKENVFYRFELVSLSANVVTMNLVGDDGSSFSSTFSSIPTTSVKGNTGGGTFSLAVANGIFAMSQTANASNTTSNMVWAPGSVVKVTGAANSYFNKTWTIGGDFFTSHWTTYTGDSTSITETTSSATQTGYPGLMPYFAFGNDTQTTPLTKSIGLDFWAFVINHGLAGVTANPALARYW